VAEMVFLLIQTQMNVENQIQQAFWNGRPENT